VVIITSRPALPGWEGKRSMSSTRRQQAVDRIIAQKVSAIIRTHDQALAADAMSAAVAGGVRIVEFTLTTPGAMELIARFAENPDLLVGAGTVLTVDQARAAVDAGARFLVSPVCDPVVIGEAARLGAASIPGTCTPTEMQAAHRAGADFVKLFPAQADVIDFVRSVLGPLPHLRIFPTAGISIENFTDVIRAGAVGVGFVRPLFAPDDLARRDFASIEKRAADIMNRLHSL
jgi:Entner-Doudoroff aldolase